jgi:hypothetical protein
MKARNTLLLAGLAISLALLNAPAATPFHSGSTGADGPLNITSNTTIVVTNNGIYHHTTIYVASNVTLRYEKSGTTSFTPVHLLATGDVAINGTIDVSGQNGGAYGGWGGPGGFDGGEAGFPATGLPAGDGMGPGGGQRDLGLCVGPWAPIYFAGCGSYAQAGAVGCGISSSSTYGNRLVMPLIGGSGGGGCLGIGTTTNGLGGGGGGGAILVASSTRVGIQGQLKARGGAGAARAGGVGSVSGSGSGGAVRIVAPEVVGTGVLDTRGGQYHPNNPQIAGGLGWIRIDTFFRTGINFITTNGVYSIGSFMQVFPDPPARLSIIQAAGEVIPEGETAPVIVSLPPGSSTNQTVTVLARDFVGTVPIRVVLTPESGPSASYDATIDMAVTNAVTVPVVMPVNTLTRIHAWSR